MEMKQEEMKEENLLKEAEQAKEEQKKMYLTVETVKRLKDVPCSKKKGCLLIDPEDFDAELINRLALAGLHVSKEDDKQGIIIRRLHSPPKFVSEENKYALLFETIPVVKDVFVTIPDSYESLASQTNKKKPVDALLDPEYSSLSRKLWSSKRFVLENMYSLAKQLTHLTKHGLIISGLRFEDLVYDPRFQKYRIDLVSSKRKFNTAFLKTEKKCWSMWYDFARNVLQRMVTQYNLTRRKYSSSSSKKTKEESNDDLLQAFVFKLESELSNMKKNKDCQDTGREVEQEILSLLQALADEKN